MKLPRAEEAVIPVEKIRDYLLSPTHPIGRFKASFFLALGFSQRRWQELDVQIRELTRNGDVVAGSRSEYGEKYLVSGILRGPAGKTAALMTVWIVRDGETVPRLITAYPRG